MVASEAPVAESKVSGTFALPEGAVLPDGAEWKVRLEDTSLADAPAVLVNEAGGVDRSDRDRDPLRDRV